MRPFCAAEVAGRMGAQDNAPGAVVTGFATDSRGVVPGDLFLAIRGEKVDGHAYVGQAVANGAAAALVERPVAGPHLLVDDVVEALARFGRSLRDEFAGPVVGLTGSAGKTTTKEFLAAALSPLGEVVKTVGNRNSEYTSPLLWADVTPETRAVVVEMGMRGFGQIAHLASIHRPTMGLITNVGWSHLLQVGDRAGIARAKGELLMALPDDDPCLLPADDDYLGELKRTAGGRPVLTFGIAEGADCRVLERRFVSMSQAFTKVRCLGEEVSFSTPAGRHIAIDASAAILAARILRVPLAKAAGALSHVVLPPNRMEAVQRNGATILLDAYNAAPNSVLAALDTLFEMPVAGRRLAVLGEMKELGSATEEGHRMVGARASKLDDVIFVGETAGLMREAAGKGRTGDLDDVRAFLGELQEGDVVLVKGSRVAGVGAGPWLIPCPSCRSRSGRRSPSPRCSPSPFLRPS